jgi:membrane protein DedA with SNARE-associated domain
VTLPQVLAEYGYVAVLVGSLLEGETILVLAGFAAHQGYLSLPWVVVVAFTGGALGDQGFFFIGRHWGNALLRRLPRFDRSAQQVRKLLMRHHTGLIISVRFMYGLRIVGPIVIGMSEVPAGRFLALNLIGAAIWSVIIAGAGFLFGHTLQMLLVKADLYEGPAAVVLVLTAVLAGVVRQCRRRRKPRNRARNDPSGRQR